MVSTIKDNFLIFIYVYLYVWCFVCMYECAPHVSEETRSCCLLELELEMVASSYVSAGSKTWVPWKSKKHSTVNHCSSQDKSIFRSSLTYINTEHPSPISEVEIKTQGTIF